MNGECQELKWLESSEYASWGSHVAQTMEKESPQPQERYSLSGACAGQLNGHIVVLVGGREESPSECFTSVSRLDLFDLNTTKWMTDYDVQGSLTHRIGHSVVTIEGKAYTFGGEQLIDDVGYDSDNHPQQLLGDAYEISYSDNILSCTDISPVSGDSSDPNAPPVPLPCKRVWHASAAVCFIDSASTPETPSTHGMLVVGGKDSQGAVLSDIWLLTLNTEKGPHWTQLSPSGTSPLPLAFHCAVPLGDGDQVVVMGGKQHADPLTTAMNREIHLLDMANNVWSVVAIANENAAISEASTSLTARCCATALAMQLPIDETTGVVRRIKPDDKNPKPYETQEVVVIFGGFSEFESALMPSSMLILEAKRPRLREVHLPNARLGSYMAHAVAVGPDHRAFFLFGGSPTPDPDEYDEPQSYLDTTRALDFWKTPPDFPSEADEEAQCQADANPIKTKTLSNGDVYVGEMNATQTQRHGKGKCSYVNGDEYDGDWLDDQRSGQGVMNFASTQDVYAGQWEHDQRHGYGIYEYHMNTSENAENLQNPQRQPKKYEGQWTHDLKHGPGTLTFSDNSHLVGSWTNGELQARANSRLEGYDDGQNGSCSYVGEVLDGKPHGHGESRHEASGEVYVGSWVDGKRCGHGVETLRDGSVYRGEWRNGRRNGFGVLDDVRTRARYNGKWVGGVRCGRGVCTYANGCAYDGDWLDNERHGTGRYSFADGSCYDGAWQHDTFCGDGSFVLFIDDGNSLRPRTTENSDSNGK